MRAAFDRMGGDAFATAIEARGVDGDITVRHGRGCPGCVTFWWMRGSSFEAGTPRAVCTLYPVGRACWRDCGRVQVTGGCSGDFGNGMIADTVFTTGMLKRRGSILLLSCSSFGSRG